VFYIGYIASELRRRAGRTLLTALGLGVGVGLVVAVAALSSGLDDAQDEVLEPLTGVGTDMSVTRPINLSRGGGQDLSAPERKQLEDENVAARVDLVDAGDPGESFTRTNFVSTTQLSFPATEVSRIAARDGVADAAGSLTLSAVTLSGTVPEGGFGGGAGMGGVMRSQNVDVDSLTVTGIDPSSSSLAAVTPGQIEQGRYLSDDGSHQAVLNVAYARRKNLGLGDTITLRDDEYEIVGLSRAPLGGQASDVYVKLDQLQRAAGRKGRVNTVLVRADSSDDVDAVAREIRSSFTGSSVTTASDLAGRVGGSLTNAKDLADKLGLALTLVALVAAFLIASLLTLSSVSKRVRELGTLKALGWPRWNVVRQVTAESLAQGALGGVLGALIGVAGAAAINAIGISLNAEVAAPDAPATAFGFGQSQVTAGSTAVTLHAPVDLGLVVLAISLALLGGLLAGSVGGLRAARLRPADALRHIG
jgi:ABC-type antimicrobial peptide transport system permease subunit